MFENAFSRRKGYSPPPVQGNLEELSDQARNHLWDIFYLKIYLTHIAPDARPIPPFDIFLQAVWKGIYHGRIDELPPAYLLLRKLKTDFLKGVWHCPLDIFEAVFDGAGDLMRFPDEVASQIRAALERENQAYTFVGGRFIERMPGYEVTSVETALKTEIEAVREHFETALQMHTDRDAPDFRNSIKESISAVEATCRYSTKHENATLAEALKLLDGHRPIHPAFRDGMIKLYGWTSDEGGIRHSIKDADKVERADAQYMLVACSAFVNYLLTR